MSNWRLQAACLGVDPSVFFPDQETGRAYDKARAYCDRCPVRRQCIELAIATRSIGIWGGVNITRDSTLKPDDLRLLALTGVGHGDKPGTVAGYYREARARVEHCDACREAYNAKQNAKRLASLARV